MSQSLKFKLGLLFSVVIAFTTSPPAEAGKKPPVPAQKCRSVMIHLVGSTVLLSGLTYALFNGQTDEIPSPSRSSSSPSAARKNETGDIEAKLKAEIRHLEATSPLISPVFSIRESEFISRYSNKRADLQKFLKLGNLDFPQTVEEIEKDGVRVIFIAKRTGTLRNPLAKKQNAGISESALVSAEEALSLPLIGMEGSLDGVYIPSGQPEIPGKQGGIPNPFVDQAVILLEVDGRRVDPRFVLQHEYAHYLLGRSETEEDFRRFAQQKKLLSDLQAKFEAVFSQVSDQSPLSRENSRTILKLYSQIVTVQSEIAERETMYEFDALTLQLETMQLTKLPPKEVASALDYLFQVSKKVEGLVNWQSDHPLALLAVQQLDELGPDSLADYRDFLKAQRRLVELSRSARHYGQSFLKKQPSSK
jgi:hypothetical protein